MAAIKNPGHYWPGDPRTNKGKALVNRRGPITTSLGPIRTLFEHMDKHSIPYQGLPCRESMERYRTGKRGLTLYTLIEWADQLGFDIVAVPRSGAAGHGATPATPRHGDCTHSAVGTAPATCGPPRVRAA